MRFLAAIRAGGNYTFIQKSILLLGAFGVAGHLVFYFILSYGFGYWESLTLRLLLAGAYGSLLLFPREGSLRFWHKAWFETMAAATLPAFFTYMFLMNGETSTGIPRSYSRDSCTA